MSRLPDLEAWALFALVIELGSFSKAAKSAGLSQPTVSKVISRLEYRLGTALLHRTARGISLTAAGEAAHDRARLILEAGLDTESEVTEQASLPNGSVRVIAPASFGIRHLAPLVPAFLDQYPRIRVELSLGGQLVDLLSGAADLAISIGELSGSSLRTRKVSAVHQRLVAAPAYLARHGRPQHPRELAEHECLISGNRAAPEVWRLRHAATGVEAAPAVDGRLWADNADVLWPALLAGQGISLQPAFMVNDALEAGALEELLPEWRADELPINLLLPPSRLQPTRVSVFADYLRRSLAGRPWAGSVAGAPQPSPTDALATDDADLGHDELPPAWQPAVQRAKFVSGVAP